MERIIKPYRGDEKYIFISYSLKDNNAVLDIVDKLQTEGYRIYFDGAIEPGTDWDVHTARRIKNCEYIIAFLSNNFFSSRNRRDELNYARDLGKPILLIYLEDCVLPEGMDMRFGRCQSIFKYRYSTEYAFYDTLFNAEGITVCLDKSNSNTKLTDKQITEASANHRTITKQDNNENSHNNRELFLSYVGIHKDNFEDR